MLETRVIRSYAKKPLKHFHGGTPSSGILQGMTLRGNKRAPNRATRFMYAKAGSPTSGNAHGDGILIVILKNRVVQEGMKESALEGGPERASDTGTQER